MSIIKDSVPLGDVKFVSFEDNNVEAVAGGADVSAACEGADVVVCVSAVGAEGGIAAPILAEKLEGKVEVRNLVGGIVAWYNAGGEVVDGSKEVAERLVGDALDLLEQSPGGDDPPLGGVVLRAFLVGQWDRHESDPGLGAHPVGDGGAEVVAITDATEVGEEDRVDGVIGTLQGGGEAEPLLVLREKALA